MFPQTDEISNIISDAVKIVFKRRLVDRVLRLWTEMARGQGLPRRDQIDPSKLGVDWANCFVIAVQSPVSLSYFAICGVNLSFAFGPGDSLAGVLLSHLPQVLSERRCLMIEGRARLRDIGILYRSALYPLSDGMIIDGVLGAANYRLLSENEYPLTPLVRTKWL
jgi:PAS domain